MGSKFKLCQTDDLHKLTKEILDHGSTFVKYRMPLLDCTYVSGDGPMRNFQKVFESWRRNSFLSFILDQMLEIHHTQYGLREVHNLTMTLLIVINYVYGDDIGVQTYLQLNVRRQEALLVYMRTVTVAFLNSVTSRLLTKGGPSDFGKLSYETGSVGSGNHEVILSVCGRVAKKVFPTHIVDGDVHFPDYQAYRELLTLAYLRHCTENDIDPQSPISDIGSGSSSVDVDPPRRKVGTRSDVTTPGTIKCDTGPNCDTDVVTGSGSSTDIQPDPGSTTSTKWLPGSTSCVATMLGATISPDNTVDLYFPAYRGGTLFATLCKEVKETCHTDPKLAMARCKDLVTAIHFIHRNGIVHFDVKLENVLLHREDDDERLVLIDFDNSVYGPIRCISREDDLRTTINTRPPEQWIEIKSTVESMAPHANQLVDYRPSDIWSLAIVLCCVLSRPFFVAWSKFWKLIIDENLPLDDNCLRNLYLLLWHELNVLEKKCIYPKAYLQSIRGCLAEDMATRPTSRKLYEIFCLSSTQTVQTIWLPETTDCAGRPAKRRKRENAVEGSTSRRPLI